MVLSAETTEQSSTMKSPRIPIPLSALSTITQPNQVSLGNAVIDMQQLQAFLMTLQPQLSHTTSANFDSSSSNDDGTTLAAFQGDLHCNMTEEATENQASGSVSTGLMTINDSFTNRSLESYDTLVKSSEDIELSPREYMHFFVF